MEQWQKVDEAAERYGVTPRDAVRLGFVDGSVEDIDKAESFHRREMKRIEWEANRMGESLKLQLNADDYRLLLVRIGKKSAPRWPMAKLKKSLKKFAEWAEAVEDQLNDEDFELAADIIEALEDGDGVELIQPQGQQEEQHEEVPAKREKQKPQPKPKAKPKSESKVKKNSEKPKRRRRRKPSNKEKLYKLWLESEDRSSKIAEKLYEAVDGAVKLSSIKTWISNWKRGKNLPVPSCDD